MNNNIKALRKVDEKGRRFISSVFLIYLIVPNLINIFYANKAIDPVNFNQTDYYSTQFIYFIKNIFGTFLIISIFSILEIKKYINFFFLPITKEEFFIFFQKNKQITIISTIVTYLATFLITGIMFKVKPYFIINAVIFLMLITVFIYYVSTVLTSSLFILSPSSYADIIMYLGISGGGILSLIPASKLMVASRYLSKFVLIDIFNLNIIAILAILTFLIFFIWNVQNKLYQRVFVKAMKSQQQQREVKKYISASRIKASKTLFAYIRNEKILIKKGYFKLISGIFTSIILFSQVLSVAIADSEMIATKTSLLLGLLYMIALFTDFSTLNYTVNSIAYMDEFIEWIKATCLNVKSYFMAKLLVKFFINTVFFVLYTLVIYSALVLIANKNISVDIVNITIISYFNMLLICYFDNKLDFRYVIFSNDMNFGLFWTKFIKYSGWIFTKIVIALMQILIVIYFIKNIYIAALFSYFIIFIVQYFFDEIISIKTPNKRPARKGNNESIDQLIKGF